MSIGDRCSQLTHCSDSEWRLGTRTGLARLEPPAGDAITLEVRDRGPDFAPQEEQRVFEKFYRGRSDCARGAGLGLAICQAITQVHGGTIEAFNRAGGGAVFRIRLPLGGVP